MKLLLLTVVPYPAQKLRMERIFLNIWRKKFRGKHTLQDVQADFKNGENGLVKLSLIDRMEETDTGIYESKL